MFQLIVLFCVNYLTITLWPVREAKFIVTELPEVLMSFIFFQAYRQ